MRRSVIALLPVIAVAVLFSHAALADSELVVDAPSISPTELDARRNAGTAPAVIDVRTAEEYATGHIPGSLNIPFDEVAERISEIDTPNGVALYCMVGPRARKGEKALQAIGYESIFHIEGGLAAWMAAGLPIDE